MLELYQVESSCRWGASPHYRCKCPYKQTLETCNPKCSDYESNGEKPSSHLQRCAAEEKHRKKRGLED